MDLINKKKSSIMISFKNFVKYLRWLFFFRLFLNQYQWINENLVDSKRRNKRMFKKALKRELVLDNPILYNDKIQWLKFNWYSIHASRMVDKFEVRSYVAETIGENYLNDIIGIYDDLTSISFESLPSMFAIKCTHGSGFNIICPDKSYLDWKIAQKKIKNWLKIKFYLLGNEYVYKGIEPRILIENYLSIDNNSGINDYKFFTFHGKVEFLYVSYKKFDIFGKVTKKRKYFNLDWNEISLNDKDEIVFIHSDELKPPFIEKMIELSQILARPFPHVRVDFNYERNKILFSELTFFHSNGMEKFPSLAFEVYMGRFLDLTKLEI